MTTTGDELRDEVRSRYAEAAVAAEAGGCGCTEDGGCCGNVACDGEPGDFGEALYDAEQRAELPDTAALASLGCGNPTAVADLHEGETVLDLGSGGGIDVILSAKRVGPTGTAYGLDMTDEMLALARQNARDAEVTNVHFLKGYIEQIPLPAESVDVVISNCVINLSTDKGAVLSEIGRVLRRGDESASATSSRRIASAPKSAQSAGASSAASPVRFQRASTRRDWKRPASQKISVEFTHQVADGMHGAIVKGVKARTPEKRGLPVVEPANTVSCC